jgi:hypothetical protein
VCVSAVPGSANEPLSVVDWPSLISAGLRLSSKFAGATLETPIDWLALPTPRSSSVTVRLSTYEPLSSGVKLKFAAAPLANGAPFFVTLQAYVNVSSAPGSVTRLVARTAVPSKPPLETP